MAGYKCKCGGKNVKYDAQMQEHQSNVTIKEGRITSKEHETEKGKNLLFCPDCKHRGYMDDFEVFGE